MNTHYRVSRGFSQLSNSALEPFTNNVVTGMTDNPAFPTPIVPIPELKATLTAFSEAASAALNGGKIEIARRDAARAVLVNRLRQQASYVESVAGDDLPTLLSSGFKEMSTNRTPIPLTAPVIDRVENLQSTQLALRLQAVPTARAYEVRLSFASGQWTTAGIYTQSRKIVLTNLTPGTVYTIQARAIGGSTGSSDWSDPVSHMSL